MGSAGASSKPIQDTNLDLNAKVMAADEQNNQFKSSDKSPLQNPGTIEELHKRCKGHDNFIYSTLNPVVH
jgi:hypothetical protein